MNEDKWFVFEDTTSYENIIPSFKTFQDGRTHEKGHKTTKFAPKDCPKHMAEASRCMRSP